MSDLTPDREGFVTEDGHRIHYEYFGRGDREVICLLNGLAMHTKAWYGFLPRLLPELDVVLYDYPGQGASSAHDVPYFIPRIAAYLTHIADTLGVRRLHLMGISYGGFVGLDYARQFQDRLYTLALSGILLSHEILFQMYQDLSLRFYRGGPEAFNLYTQPRRRIRSSRVSTTISPATAPSGRRCSSWPAPRTARFRRGCRRS